MAYLLDVDVLIARCDTAHESHERVREWLRAHDDLSLRNEGQFGTLAGVDAQDVQAVYLLTLAASRGIKFVTLNGRMDPRLFRKETAGALTVIR